jgi:hypothetical protein
MAVAIRSLTTESLSLLPEHRRQFRVDHSFCRQPLQDWQTLIIENIAITLKTLVLEAAGNTGTDARVSTDILFVRPGGYAALHYLLK